MRKKSGILYFAQRTWNLVNVYFYFVSLYLFLFFSIFQAEKRNLANVYGPTELLPSTDLVPNLQET